MEIYSIYCLLVKIYYILMSAISFKQHLLFYWQGICAHIIHSLLQPWVKIPTCFKEFPLTAKAHLWTEKLEVGSTPFKTVFSFPKTSWNFALQHSMKVFFLWSAPLELCKFWLEQKNQKEQTVLLNMTSSYATLLEVIQVATYSTAMWLSLYLEQICIQMILRWIRWFSPPGYLFIYFSHD